MRAIPAMSVIWFECGFFWVSAVSRVCVALYQGAHISAQAAQTLF